MAFTFLFIFIEPFKGNITKSC